MKLDRKEMHVLSSKKQSYRSSASGNRVNMNDSSEAWESLDLCVCV